MSKQHDASEAIIHLTSDLYLVRSDLIQYADGNHIVNGIQFINPRHVTIKGRATSRGMDRTKMEEIRESIRTQGLKHPLIVFGKTTGEQRVLLLSGERRKRSIDKLKSDKALCFDGEKGEMKPAAERYEYIECRISQKADVKELYREAFSVNDTSEDIGEVAVVSLVKQWKDENWTEKDIENVTGKSITWVRETLAIINLDEKCYEAFLKEEINRTCAISLSEVKGVTDRQTRCAKMKAKAAERYGAMVTEAEVELEAAEAEAEAAEVDVELAANQLEKVEATKKLENVAKKVERKRAKVKQVKHRKAKATGKELAKVHLETTGDTTKHVTAPKYNKHWVPVLDKCDAGKGPIPPETSRIIRAVIEEGWFKDVRDLELFLEKVSKPLIQMAV